MRGLEVVKSALHRFGKRIVSDIYLDLRDAKQWCGDHVSRWSVHIMEKWLGFSYAFLCIFLIGGVGYLFILVSLKASDVALIMELVPAVFLSLVGSGFLFTFLFGIALSALFLLSLLRLLLWGGDLLKHYWRENTPPYLSADANTSKQEWPPSQEEIDEAMARVLKFTKISTSQSVTR